VRSCRGLGGQFVAARLICRAQSSAINHHLPDPICCRCRCRRRRRPCKRPVARRGWPLRWRRQAGPQSPLRRSLKRASRLLAFALAAVWPLRRLDRLAEWAAREPLAPIRRHMQPAARSASLRLPHLALVLSLAPLASSLSLSLWLAALPEEGGGRFKLMIMVAIRKTSGRKSRPTKLELATLTTWPRRPPLGQLLAGGPISGPLASRPIEPPPCKSIN